MPKREASSSSDSSAVSGGESDEEAGDRGSVLGGQVKSDDGSEAGEKRSIFKRFCGKPAGMSSIMSWTIWVSALLIVLPCIFISLSVVLDSFFPFPVYRANLRQGDIELTTSKEGRVPGLYWKSAKVDEGLPSENSVRFRTGVIPLTCEQQKEQSVWAWAPKSYIKQTPGASYENTRSLYVALKECNFKGSEEELQDWQCLSSWEIVGGPTGSETQFSKDNNDCLVSVPDSFVPIREPSAQKFLPVLQTEPIGMKAGGKVDASHTDMTLVFKVQEVKGHMAQQHCEHGIGKGGMTKGIHWKAMKAHTHEIKAQDVVADDEQDEDASDSASNSQKKKKDPKKFADSDKWKARYKIYFLCHEPVNFLLRIGVSSREIMNIFMCMIILYYEAREFWGGRRGVWYERVGIQLFRFLIFFFIGGMLLGEVSVGGSPGGFSGTNWYFRVTAFFSIAWAFAHLVLIVKWKESKNDDGNHSFALRFFGFSKGTAQAVTAVTKTRAQGGGSLFDTATAWFGGGSAAKKKAKKEEQDESDVSSSEPESSDPSRPPSPRKKDSSFSEW